MSPWIKFAAAQLVMLVAQVVGLVVLLPFCVAKAWTAPIDPSTDQKPWLPLRYVDRWRWAPLNAVYGNPADGVSGQTALVWGSGVNAGKLVPFMPGAPAWWRAYCWSAWRNSADALKYVFAWRQPQPAPYKQLSLFGRTLSLGWKLENGSAYVPVLSLA